MSEGSQPSSDHGFFFFSSGVEALPGRVLLSEVVPMTEDGFKDPVYSVQQYCHKEVRASSGLEGLQLRV